MTKIMLSDIVEAMEMQNEESSFYLNIKTYEIISFYNEDSDLIDEDLVNEDKELRNTAIESENYIQIPDKFDINEYRMMERFSISIPGEVGDILYDNLSGSGAFSRFRNNISRFDLEDKWYKFREKSYFENAKDWCEINEIQFVDSRNK